MPLVTTAEALFFFPRDGWFQAPLDGMSMSSGFINYIYIDREIDPKRLQTIWAYIIYIFYASQILDTSTQSKEFIGGGKS